MLGMTVYNVDQLISTYLFISDYVQPISYYMWCWFKSHNGGIGKLNVLFLYRQAFDMS